MEKELKQLRHLQKNMTTASARVPSESGDIYWIARPKVWGSPSFDAFIEEWMLDHVDTLAASTMEACVDTVLTQAILPRMCVLRFPKKAGFVHVLGEIRNVLKIPLKVFEVQCLELILRKSREVVTKNARPKPEAEVKQFKQNIMVGGQWGVWIGPGRVDRGDTIQEVSDEQAENDDKNILLDEMDVTYTLDKGKNERNITAYEVFTHDEDAMDRVGASYASLRRRVSLVGVHKAIKLVTSMIGTLLEEDPHTKAKKHFMKC